MMWISFKGFTIIFPSPYMNELTYNRQYKKYG